MSPPELLPELPPESLPESPPEPLPELLPELEEPEEPPELLSKPASLNAPALPPQPRAHTIPTIPTTRMQGIVAKAHASVDRPRPCWTVTCTRRLVERCAAVHVPDRVDQDGDAGGVGHWHVYSVPTQDHRAASCCGSRPASSQSQV